MKTEGPRCRYRVLRQSGRFTQKPLAQHAVRVFRERAYQGAVGLQGAVSYGKLASRYQVPLLNGAYEPRDDRFA